MIDWLSLWNQKAATNNFLTQTGRGNSFNLDKFLLYMQDVNNALLLDKSDTLLDIGGASGWISLWLLPFVKSVTMFDYSEEMIIKAQKQAAGFDNITIFQDDILTMTKVEGTYSKVLVGSVLQYLKNMDEVETALKNIYNVMKPGGIALFSHNPDAREKESHLATVKPENMQMELERLWINPDDVRDVAMNKIGFKEYRIVPINPAIWQSTHMLDMVMVK